MLEAFRWSLPSFLSCSIEKISVRGEQKEIHRVHFSISGYVWTEPRNWVSFRRGKLEWALHSILCGILLITIFQSPLDSFPFPRCHFTSAPFQGQQSMRFGCHAGPDCRIGNAEMGVSLDQESTCLFRRSVPLTPIYENKKSADRLAGVDECGRRSLPDTMGRLWVVYSWGTARRSLF